MNTRIEMWRWRIEISYAHFVLFLIQAAGPIGVSPDLRRFFIDRYLRLAAYHRKRGRTAKASRLVAKAALHWHALTPDEPPPSLASVMPVPLPPIFTWVVAARDAVRSWRKAA